MLPQILAPLFTPLNYLRVRHSLKIWFDLWVPLAIGLFATVGLATLPDTITIFGDHGLLAVITGLLQILIGFYIAALAAVATFERQSLDQPLDGESATLSVKRRGQSLELDLSRRRFLCYLFGYLAFVSLVLYFVGSSVNLLVSNASYLIPVAFHATARWIFIFLYLFVTSNALVTTLLGLHYLVDRIHR